MFRTIAILASIVGAAAFTPAGRMARSSSLKMDYSSEAGVTQPTGFFDPWGLSKDIDADTFAFVSLIFNPYLYSTTHLTQLRCLLIFFLHFIFLFCTCNVVPPCRAQARPYLPIGRLRLRRP